MFALAVSCNTCQRTPKAEVAISDHAIGWLTPREILEENGWETKKDGQIRSCPLCVADRVAELEAAEREAAEQDAYFEEERRGAAGEFTRAHKIAA